MYMIFSSFVISMIITSLFFIGLEGLYFENKNLYKITIISFLTIFTLIFLLLNVNENIAKSRSTDQQIIERLYK